MTVSKAFSHLERDGIVERRPGRPLVVKQLQSGQLQSRRLDQLRDSLAPSVTVVRQLGIDWEEALRLFGELLAADEERSQDSEEKP